MLNIFREVQIREGIQKGELLPRATISTIKEQTAGILEGKTFAEGDAIKCVKKPWGARFPEVGDVVVVVSQDGMNLAVSNEPGDCLAASDLGDTIVAVPRIADTGWQLYQIHSSCFEKATDEEVAAADKKLLEAAAKLLAEANPKTESTEN